MNILKKLVIQLIDDGLSKRLPEELKHTLTELKPDCAYILIVPESLDGDALRRAFEEFAGKTNLLVLQADGVKLLELTHGK